MDDKTFIASYVAQESQRINERLKKTITSDIPPSDEEKEALVHDIEATLSRLQRALSQIQLEVEEEERTKLVAQ